MATRKKAARITAPKGRPRRGKASAATKAAALPPEESAEDAGSPGSALVVVESPAKAKTIGKYLGRGYRVRATVGHIRDLPQKKLGVDVENGFTPQYVTIEGKEKTVAELKNAAKDASEIFLATDPDREGEAIAWHVASQIGGPMVGRGAKARRTGPPIRRALFHEITKDAVRSAIANWRRGDRWRCFFRGMGEIARIGFRRPAS